MRRARHGTPYLTKNGAPGTRRRNRPVFDSEVVGNRSGLYGCPVIGGIEWIGTG